jgi:hypothetical protein
MASWEDASRCPRCDLPGEEVNRLPGKKPGYKVATLLCRNDKCRWFNTGWAVQINPDGSVPEARDRKPDDREERMYPRINPLLFNQRNKAALEQGQRILDADTRGGGEVR